MGQHRSLDLLKAWARLDPELVDQLPSGALVTVQGVHLAARAIQRDHQLLVQALAQRVLMYECLELGHGCGVLSEAEIRLDSILDRP
jgi:hypothetical protein